MSTTITYGRVTLEMCTILQWQRRVINHGPTALYTAHRLLVRGYYNPASTSYAFDEANLVPVALRRV